MVNHYLLLLLLFIVGKFVVVFDLFERVNCFGAFAANNSIPQTMARNEAAMILLGQYLGLPQQTKPGLLTVVSCFRT